MACPSAGHGGTPPGCVQRYCHDQRIPLILPLKIAETGCNDTLGRAGVSSCRKISHLLRDHRIVAPAMARSGPVKTKIPHLPYPCVSNGVHYSKLDGLSTYDSNRRMCSKAGVREARYGHVPQKPCRAMDRPTSLDKRVAHWSMAASSLASSTSRKQTGFTGEV
jgi:hypothetical protein